MTPSICVGKIPQTCVEVGSKWAEINDDDKKIPRLFKNWEINAQSGGDEEI